MLKGFSYILICGSLLALSACASHPAAPAYEYKGDSNSAYIKGTVIEKEALFGKSVDNGIVPIMIDEKQLMAKSNDPNLAIKESIAISPGSHRISALFRTSSEKAFVNFTLNALPHEHYTIKHSVVWNKGLIMDSANTVTFWVEDSRGVKVVDAETVGAQSNQANQSVFVPMFIKGK